MLQARVETRDSNQVPAAPSTRSKALLFVIAIVAMAVPALIVGFGPRWHAPAALTAPKRVVPKTELPPVEPVEVVALPPEAARAYNAGVPFSTAPNPAARPFRLTGNAEDQARAVDCLAAAEVYEAPDSEGQRAVAQVVLNRLRHPAFPRSICAVVFQGSERTTGCQFTFTCDGALARWHPSLEQWQRARDIARAALAGAVYRPVGHATHYHTDWVVPYWSASLDKITAVGSHLFFRWAGWWGTPPAFTQDYAAAEPMIPKLVSLSEAHRPTGDLAATTQATLAASLDAVQALGEAQIPRAVTTDNNTFLVLLAPKLSPDAFPALAVRTCGNRPYCKFMAWMDAKAKPEGLPISTAAMASMSFSYLHDEQQQFAKPLWNCEQFQRPSPLQCMRSALIGRLDTAPRTETFQLRDLRPKLPPSNPQLQDLSPRTGSAPGSGPGQRDAAQIAAPVAPPAAAP